MSSDYPQELGLNLVYVESDGDLEQVINDELAGGSDAPKPLFTTQIHMEALNRQRGEQIYRQELIVYPEGAVAYIDDTTQIFCFERTGRDLAQRAAETLTSWFFF